MIDWAAAGSSGGALEAEIDKRWEPGGKSGSGSE